MIKAVLVLSLSNSYSIKKFSFAANKLNIFIWIALQEYLIPKTLDFTNKKRTKNFSLFQLISLISTTLKKLILKKLSIFSDAKA